MVSILTGPEGPVLPPGVTPVRLVQGVSILTGPEGPVLRPDRINRAGPERFQSSPAPKGRCYGWRRPSAPSRSCFNPHRPRRAGATLYCSDRALRHRGVSILTGPEGPVLLGLPGLRRGVRPVSILTGPEGPVLPDRERRPRSAWFCFNPHRPRRAGATGDGQAAQGGGKRFQSSPAPKGRCYTSTTASACRSEFQSSPAPKGRCYSSGSSSPAAASGFNPHRPRRAGATTTTGYLCRWVCLFQSSPAPKGRCYGQGSRPVSVTVEEVSILTGPEGPVLQGQADGQVAPSGAVSILTGPEGPVLPALLCPGCARDLQFQSSPAPKGRCY